MDVKAAVAVAAGKPLGNFTTVQLDGPKAGEVMIEIKATGICHTDEFALGRRSEGPLRNIWVMKVPVWSSRWVRTSPRSRWAIT